MNSKVLGFAGVVLVVAGVAVWLSRGPTADPNFPSLPEAVDRRAPAHPAPLPAPGSAVDRQTEPQPEMTSGPKPGNGAGSIASAKPASPAPGPDARERAFIAKLFEPPSPSATDQERQLWDESPVQDLLYPQGHPCAGQPLDSTSPDALAEAGVQALHLENVPDADEPQCVYQGNWPFHPLNQACSSVNPLDPDAVALCTSYLLTGPQDPQAYPATVWLPCVDSSRATTRRAHLESIVRDRVERIFAGPRCTAG